MWGQFWGRAFFAGTNRSVSKVDEKINSSECQATDSGKENKQTNYLTTAKYICSSNVKLKDEPEEPMLIACNHLQLSHNARLHKTCLYGFPFCCNSFPATVPNGSCTNSGNMCEQYQFNISIMATDFLEHRDLDVLTSQECFAQGLDNCNAVTLHDDCTECRCKFCLSKIKAINSIVSKAKRLIAKAVDSLNKSQSPMYDTQCCEGKTYFYLINLAHLLLIITCLRGVL